MPVYRLYCLRKGRIVSGENFDADDDDSAIASVRARKLEVGHEIWQAARLVAAIAPGGEPIRPAAKPGRTPPVR